MTTTSRLAILTLVFLSLTWAQSTAVISGTVVDQTGAMVPGAAVTAVQQQTDQRFNAVTDAQGRFSFPRLPTGNYKVEVTHPGFRRFESEAIRLDADQTRQANVALQVGEASESVQVSGAIALVETIGGGLRETVDEKRISDLPLDGRNALSLQLLVPGSVPGAAANSGLGENVATSINGARGDANNYLLDGGDNNDPQLNTPAIVPNPDSLEEFSILTNNYSAEYGRSAGAVVNAITKSGTNEFHGSAYEFVRNYDFDGRNFFSLTAPKLQRNQFGASFGGPVWIPKVYKGRDRTFFFVSYEGLRQRQAATVSNTIVPTALERAGDFSQSKLKPTDPTTKAPFPNALIPASRFDPAGQKFLSIFIPLPDAPGGKYIFNSPDNLDHDQIIAKVDHNIGSKHRITGRYFHDWSSELQTAGLPVLTQDNNFDTQSAMGNYTWTVTPSLLNTAQLSYSRLFLNRGPLPVGNNVTYQTLGVNAVADTPQYPTDYRGAVNGYWNLNQNNLVTILNQTYMVFDNVSYMLRGHMLKFGGEYRHATSDRYTANLTDPQFTFNGQFTTNAFADFLIGLPSVMSQGSLRVNAIRSPEMSFFFQDDWKLRSNLTVSMGLRWEPWFPDYDANNQLSVFRPGQQSTVYPTAPLGTLFPGDAGVPRGGVPDDWKNLAPRFGLAWNPTPKTSVRAAYGIFYDTAAIHQLSAFSSNQPFSVQVAINDPYSFSDPYHGMVDPFPYLPATTPQGRAQFQFILPTVVGETLAPGLKNGYMQQWNFSIQRETVQGIVVNAAYVGSKGDRLPIQRELDPAVFGPGATTANVNQRRPYAPAYSTIADYESNGFSTYDSMQLSVNKRFAHGYTILANYTWAKSIDNDSLDTAGAIQDPNDLKAEKALSDFDIRQRFVASFLWEIPSVVKSGFAKWFVAGWQLNGILTLSKGEPFNVVSGQDRALTGQGSERPNLVGNPHLSSGRSTDQLLAEYYNPAAYVLPPLGSYGNSGRNTLIAPGLENLDASLFKMIPIREKMTLQFRAEFFNSLNNVNFAAPVANISTATAGNIQSAVSNRELQFALRLRF